MPASSSPSSSLSTALPPGNFSSLSPSAASTNVTTTPTLTSTVSSSFNTTLPAAISLNASLTLAPTPSGAASLNSTHLPVSNHTVVSTSRSHLHKAHSAHTTRTTALPRSSSSRVSQTSASSSFSSSSAKPLPTSYGTTSAKNCTEVPSTFEGSMAGFANLCKGKRNMVWSGDDGEVTRAEIESALGMLQQDLEPLWENGQGNILADGSLGQGAYGASLLFEITGDIRALDVAVRIADNILALQNQNTPDPVVIWTGAVDPVWPTKPLPPSNTTELIYAGCENGDIVGHMVNAAVLILKSPCLWDMVPPVFDGPTIFNDTATYYDRALQYIAAGDEWGLTLLRFVLLATDGLDRPERRSTYDNYFNIRFLDPNGSIIQPNDPRWWEVGDSRDPGTPMPWNRRMQMVHGYLRLAAAHETEAAYNPQKTAYFDTIVKQNVEDFLAALNETKSTQNGMTIFEWDYSAGEEATEESQGIHAYYDIWGSWIAWQRSSATFFLSNQFGVQMADTFQFQINLGNGSFSGLVSGTSTPKAYTVGQLWGGWSFYGYFLPEWYQTVASANVKSGFQGRTWLAIPLLWTKHALYINDFTFWTGLYSSGYGITVGTDGSGSSSSSGGLSASAASTLSPSVLAVVSSLVIGLLTVHLSTA
ncbi:SPOSA6832_02041, partial [Sporobolomyces salmonicolor]